MRWDYLQLDINPVFPGLGEIIIVIIIIIIIIIIIVILSGIRKRNFLVLFLYEHKHIG